MNNDYKTNPLLMATKDLESKTRELIVHYEEIDHNDGGRVNWEYKCKPTLDPRLMLTEKGNTNTLATHDVLMRSFVLEKGESATYAFTSSYSGLSWFSDFKVVKFSTTPYTV